MASKFVPMDFRLSMKKQTATPYDNKINLSFDRAVERLLATKPKKKPVKKRPKKKST